MYEQDSEEWSDLTCTLIVGLIVCIPILLTFGISSVSALVISALMAIYYFMLKIFGSGYVVEGGVIVLIMSLLISILF